MGLELLPFKRSPSPDFPLRIDDSYYLAWLAEPGFEPVGWGRERVQDDGLEGLRV